MTHFIGSKTSWGEIISITERCDVPYTQHSISCANTARVHKRTYGTYSCWSKIRLIMRLCSICENDDPGLALNSVHGACTKCMVVCSNSLLCTPWALCNKLQQADVDESQWRRLNVTCEAEDKEAHIASTRLHSLTSSPCFNSSQTSVNPL